MKNNKITNNTKKTKNTNKPVLVIKSKKTIMIIGVVFILILFLALNKESIEYQIRYNQTIDYLIANGYMEMYDTYDDDVYYVYGTCSSGSHSCLRAYPQKMIFEEIQGKYPYTDSAWYVEYNLITNKARAFFDQSDFREEYHYDFNTYRMTATRWDTKTNIKTSISDDRDVMGRFLRAKEEAEELFARLEKFY